MGSSQGSPFVLQAMVKPFFLGDGDLEGTAFMSRGKALAPSSAAWLRGGTRDGAGIRGVQAGRQPVEPSTRST